MNIKKIIRNIYIRIIRKFYMRKSDMICPQAFRMLSEGKHKCSNDTVIIIGSPGKVKYTCCKANPYLVTQDVSEIKSKGVTDE